MRTFYLPLKAITKVSLKIFNRQQTAPLSLEPSEVTDPDLLKRYFPYALDIGKHWKKRKTLWIAFTRSYNIFTSLDLLETWKAFLESHVPFLVLPLFLMVYLKTNFSFGQTVQWLWASRGSAKDEVWSAHSSDAAERQPCHQHRANPMLDDNSDWNPPFTLFQTLLTVRFTQNSLIMIFLSTNGTLLALSCMHREQCKELRLHQSLPCSSGIQQAGSGAIQGGKFSQQNSISVLSFFQPFPLRGKTDMSWTFSYLVFLVLNCSSRNANYSSRWIL